MFFIGKRGKGSSLSLRHWRQSMVNKCLGRHPVTVSVLEGASHPVHPAASTAAGNPRTAKLRATNKIRKNVASSHSQTFSWGHERHCKYSDGFAYGDHLRKETPISLSGCALMDISCLWQGKCDDLPFLSLFGIATHVKKKKKNPLEASFFSHAFVYTASQQLTLITANWMCTEQSGQHASQCYGLIYRMVRGEIKSHFTHILHKQAKRAYSVSWSCFWFTMSESISALEFIHCVRLKNLFTSEHLFAISVCCFLPVWDTTQNNKVLPPEENYYSLTLSHLVVKWHHSW